ncbi:uncharacterized protein LOC143037752 [Oratosquilla oratoria]|uniref:uncharacterized protein LOC143037752 n=1 Tax=Oratosquilla oratoria TaxID=337810 RepID=UPI003F762B06
MADGSTTVVPEATVHVESDIYTGWVAAAVMRNPISDCVIGNIPGARNASTAEAETQTTAAVVTRAMLRNLSTAAPLTVPEIQELIDSKEVQDRQLDDPSLETVRRQLQDGTVRRVGQGVMTYVRKAGRMYRKFETSQEIKHQFIVPERYRQAVFKLGHEAALAGHMGYTKTLNRISKDFFWPGMATDISRWTKSCDTCQRTTDRGRVKPAPLQPLPIIATPFERVAVDIVGPIEPRSREGYKYILTLVDFATRWPEAVALKNIESTTVAEALLGIFSRLGMPKEILSDRGTQFTSGMMDEFLRLLSIRGIRTTPYHPQCNGLCERFNGTLKKMLRRMMNEQPKEWPRFIAPLLFAYREVPQSSLKHSPFELIYGRQVRGPLQMLRELWDDDVPDPVVSSTYEYVLNLADRLQATCELAKEELVKAREVQRSHFDRKAALREFLPGDKCLLLMPTSHNKLLATWRGPFEVVARNSEVNYTIQMGHHKTKRFHVNMLKNYIEPQQSVASMSIGREWVTGRRTSEQLGCLRLVRKCFRDEARELVGCATVISEETESDVGPETVQVRQGETWKEVAVSDGLTSEQKNKAVSLCREFGHIFSDKPGQAQVEPHRIELISELPVKTKPYSIPLRLVDDVKVEIDAMVEAGIIERSSSPYCSPVVVVGKKTGGVRLCGDYRKVNSITRPIAEPMSDQRMIFSRLSNSTFFSKLDLSRGFFQIGLHPESRRITAFGTPWGLYQFTVLPFGLTNAPAVFNRTMRDVLHDVPGAEVFVDDVLVHTQTFEEHMVVLRKVLEKLAAVGMTVKPSKTELGQTVIQYLGHTVGNGRCGCQDDKVKKIREAPTPTTKKQVRSFVNLVGYYRQFIPEFAAVALPLHNLLKKSAPNRVSWGETEERAFHKLKSYLCSSPILQLPNPRKPFTLRTDASQDAVGAVLLQEQDGWLYPVAYHSRKLRAAERNYSTIERELLGIVDGIKKFQFYLYGGKFVLETDHMPLEHLKPSKTANARLTRWGLYLQQFDYTLRYIKGSENLGADLLSRLGNAP